MKLLLPTGRVTADIVREAAAGRDAEVVITGELASFLTPASLRDLLRTRTPEMVIVSGMCTASFAAIEEENGIPVFLGPRHAADLKMVLENLGPDTLSREIPADEFLGARRRDEAYRIIAEREDEATAAFTIRGCRIGGNSRIKVLAEIMDAHRHPDIRGTVIASFERGADIVDLGFGFDATADDVRRVFSLLTDIPGPLAADTQDPDLILAALGRADLILSLHAGNLVAAGPAVAAAGAAAVILPEGGDIQANLAAAYAAGVRRCIIDPILDPAGMGLVRSLMRFSNLPNVPVFFGAGNVIELIDADSVGITALLAAMAYETGASVIFCSEHSDKTTGCIAEMRRASEMMALMKGRPYPKDLGIDLFSIKEKRRRREPPLEYHTLIEAGKPEGELIYDPCGNFRIGIEGPYIVAVKNGVAVKGRRWIDVMQTLIERGDLSRLDHAAYLGQELAKAELAIRFNRSFEQDGPF